MDLSFRKLEKVLFQGDEVRLNSTLKGEGCGSRTLKEKYRSQNSGLNLRVPEGNSLRDSSKAFLPFTNSYCLNISFSVRTFHSLFSNLT